jgi:hypothetical protein
MNLSKFLTREEPVAGIEISDSYLRLALLSREGSAKKPEDVSVNVVALKELALREGVVREGKIIEKKELALALGTLVRGIKPRIKYVVLSISGNNIYSRSYSFPRAISEEKLQEAMGLTLGFQLAVKQSDVYLDWEKTESEKRKDVFLATLKKGLADDYMETLSMAGLGVVAIEFYPMSIARSMFSQKDKPVMLLTADKTDIMVTILENRVIQFNRVLPIRFFADMKSLTGEIKKIINFYESENKIYVSEILSVNIDPAIFEGQFDNPVVPAKIEQDFMAYDTIQQNDNGWLVAIGSALRGILPRSQDSMVSLMPVGTEEAYENQKAINFAEFMANMTIGLSVFFIMVFAGGWGLMNYLAQSSAKGANIVSLANLPEGSAELEQRAEHLNQLLDKFSRVSPSLPRWGEIIRTVQDKKEIFVDGISVSGINLTSPEDIMTLTGSAKNRPALNAFKKSLDEWTLITEVKMPLTNIAQKENIAFTVSFKLADPTILINN